MGTECGGVRFGMNHEKVNKWNLYLEVPRWDHNLNSLPGHYLATSFLLELMTSQIQSCEPGQFYEELHSVDTTAGFSAQPSLMKLI